jgi:ABC-type dipeptide/oligopeptide/nickel transport system ATPase component
MVVITTATGQRPIEFIGGSLQRVVIAAAWAR